MNDKYYLIKLSEEEKFKFGGLDYIITFSYKGLEEDINRFGNTTILITPSKELAISTLGALSEQLREQGN